MLVARDPAYEVVADREECCTEQREPRSQGFEVVRPDALAGQRSAAGDDEHGSRDEGGVEGLSEQRQRDQHRHQRRGADQDRGARRPSVAHRHDEHDL
jgi:hypothetical protein